MSGTEGMVGTGAVVMKVAPAEGLRSSATMAHENTIVLNLTDYKGDGASMARAKEVREVLNPGFNAIEHRFSGREGEAILAKAADVSKVLGTRISAEDMSDVLLAVSKLPEGRLSGRYNMARDIAPAVLDAVRDFASTVSWSGGPEQVVPEAVIRQKMHYAAPGCASIIDNIPTNQLQWTPPETIKAMVAGAALAMYGASQKATTADASAGLKAAVR